MMISELVSCATLMIAFGLEPVSTCFVAETPAGNFSQIRSKTISLGICSLIWLATYTNSNEAFAFSAISIARSTALHALSEPSTGTKILFILPMIKSSL